MRPVAARSAETIAGVAATVACSPIPLTPYGASGSGTSTNRRDHERDVEDRRDQVVGERAIADLAALELELLHQRQAEPYRRPALDLSLRPLRVDHPTGVLRRRDLDDAGEPELLVDVDHGALGDEREGDVDLALALGVEARRRPVVVRPCA